MKNRKNDCDICQQIDLLKKVKNPYIVTKLQTGYVVMAESQFYRGYTLFLSAKHASELHQLPPKFMGLFIQEMALVSKAVWLVFKPRKLNYELLGNSQPHLHWHIIPRYKNDPKPNYPIWSLSEKIRSAKKYRPDSKKLSELKSKLLFQLKRELK